MRAKDAVRTIGLSIRRSMRDALLNGIVASSIIPDVVRTPLLRAYGIQVASYRVQPGCFFSGRRVKIGRHVFVNRGVFFDGSAPVEIGDGSSIGPQCMFITQSHRIGPSEQERTDRSAGTSIRAPIRVGRNVWLGARVVVLPGVDIGNGSVVAAGAVVTDDCEPNGLYAGVPARRVRELPS